MSKQAVQAVIGRAVTDSMFRDMLFATPEKALTGYDLSGDEVHALKAIDAESMETLAGSLDDRISKAFIIGWNAALGGGGTTAPSQGPYTGPRPAGHGPME